MPPMSGSCHPVRGGVQAVDYRRGAIILVEEDSQGAVFGVCGYKWQWGRCHSINRRSTGRQREGFDIG